MSKSISFQPPRKLRVFSFDPATGNRHANRRIREIVISVPWELDPGVGIGPDGEYIQIVDYDPASGFFYDPIDLNHPEVRHGDGLVASEEDPRFHQQMVYAVCMNTISVFEQVLGRKVLWSPRAIKSDEGNKFVRKLRIYPHALREANAYYDPEKKALLFGYFTADLTSQSTPPGSIVFTCLSHDIIVHEVCHAILDGMHPRFIENSNLDMQALHEAFADIVAIFQHFSHPEVLEDQIARTRGDLEKQNLLGALAQEFGTALGYHGALRDALGGFVDDEWQPREPDNQILERLVGPHARGAVLVAAVFRAFLSIYKSRVADLFRIASGGSGILREGEIDPDLVKRLAREAAKSAQHILRMCIRAMDYVPPVDVDFGDYLRAIITADHDLYPEDEQEYRLAIIEAFSAWGIYATEIPVITEKALLWDSLENAAANRTEFGPLDEFEVDFGVLVSRPTDILNELRRSEILKGEGSSDFFESFDTTKRKISEQLAKDLEINVMAKSKRRKSDHQSMGFSKEDVLARSLLANEFENDRYTTYLARNFYAQLFWGIINMQQNIELLSIIGVTLNDNAPLSIHRSEITGRPSLQVHSVRMASRIGKHGQKESEYVVEIIQSRDGFFDLQVQSAVDRGEMDKAKVRWNNLYGNKNFRRDFRYRCGATLLIDSKSFEIRRVIRTKYRADEDEGLDRLRNYLSENGQQARNSFDAPSIGHDCSNAFAELHRDAQLGRF